MRTEHTLQKDYSGIKGTLSLALKGALMGAADIVPGVSGGTIAFILGIYERFIKALSQANRQAFKLVTKFDVKGLWAHFDSNFLMPIFLGILLSIFTISKAVSWMLFHHPILLWSLFNGLIIFSIPFFVKAITWDVKTAIVAVLGTLFALAINLISGDIHNPTLIHIFIAGAVAVSALLLPGISGAFILVLLGMYEPVIASVKSLDLLILVTFASGCLFGMLTTSKLIAYLLRRFHDLLIAFLLGVVIGALYRIWPWQINEQPVVWSEFLQQGHDPQFMLSIIFFFFGGGLMFLLQRVDSKRNTA